MGKAARDRATRERHGKLLAGLIARRDALDREIAGLQVAKALLWRASQRRPSRVNESTSQRVNQATSS